MKAEFENWANGKIQLAHKDNGYENPTAQIAWDCWQRAWNFAVTAQREKDEVEIRNLKNKITLAKAALK